MLKPIAAALLLAGALATGAADADSPRLPSSGAGSALDHVLLWTTDVDRVTARLAVNLGFQVRPGGEFPDGVANRLVRFTDETFLELLYFTRPANQLEGGALEVFRYAEHGTGANSFALLTDDPEATRRHLSDLGQALAPPDPSTYDPDGSGQLQPLPQIWTTVAFVRSPLHASDLFFIRYSLPPRTSVQQADSAALSTHPNGAQRMSAVWLVVEDAEAELHRLERVGVGSATVPLNFPQVGARGFFVQVGDGRILVLQPAGPGIAAEALRERGPQLFGVSIETEALDRAQRLVQRGYGTDVERYQGPAGDAFLAPSRGDLGLVVEFHAAPATVSPPAGP